MTRISDGIDTGVIKPRLIGKAKNPFSRDKAVPDLREAGSEERRCDISIPSLSSSRIISNRLELYRIPNRLKREKQVLRKNVPRTVRKPLKGLRFQSEELYGGRNKRSNPRTNRSTNNII